jgi:[ribosomal protein S5]-alanine N-acetyltransferase
MTTTKPKDPQSAPGGILTGKHIDLRPFERSDIRDGYLSWFNDSVVCAYSQHNRVLYTRDAAYAYFDKVKESKNRLMFAIIQKSNSRHVGNIALNAIHDINGSADLSILIGEKSVWGQGFGKEASYLLCRYAFDNLKIHRITCGLFSENAGMKKIAEFLGMTREGLRRQAVCKDGRYVDILEYGVLKNEFRIMFKPNPTL